METPMTMPDAIYAIKYGSHVRGRPENYLGGDPHDVPEPINYYVWAIRSGARTILVDTGFDETVAAKRNRHIDRPVGQGLKAIGIDPASVTDVIVTHMHYDHAGNHALFPGARYHIQDAEMAYCTGRCMCHPEIRRTFECDDVTALVGKVFDGRVTFHDGAAEIAPGISVHPAGGHTKGLQCVRVHTARGPVVLTSDATHLFEHIDKGRVFPITWNIAEVLESYQRIKALAASRDHIVPGHDPLVMQLYPAAGPGLEGWVARLDATPKPRA
jgi:glyoxylase-like metal-dependent hydrolase (beta-lactamase superfamily II)